MCKHLASQLHSHHMLIVRKLMITSYVLSVLYITYIYSYVAAKKDVQHKCVIYRNHKVTIFNTLYLYNY